MTLFGLHVFSDDTTVINGENGAGRSWHRHGIGFTSPSKKNPKSSLINHGAG
jgi:hypothetical protein